MILNECRRARIDCLYLDVDAGNDRAANFATSHGFRLVDVRIVLERELNIPPDECDVAAGPCPGPPSARDLPRLRRIAAQVARFSRYSADPRFRAHAPTLYQQWISAACRGWAEAVFVARSCHNAVGFITCKRSRTAPHHAILDLIGVDSRHAGQGVGKALMVAFVTWARHQKFKRAHVVTQGRNVAAIRFYERMGFRVQRVSLFYHGWLAP